jgi:hypothetical protein
LQLVTILRLSWDLWCFTFSVSVQMLAFEGAGFHAYQFFGSFWYFGLEELGTGWFCFR